MSAVPNDLSVSPALSSSASTYLDSLRALGANLVVVAHVLNLYFGAEGHVFGSLGVTIFFLLSGFLIMQSMLNRTRRPGPHLPGFLADRAARILTPYVPALVIIAVTNVAFVHQMYGAPGAKEGFLAFIGNLFLLQDHSLFQALEIAGLDLSWRIRPYMTAEPFWTVAIEMWIYVAIGLFFFVALHREKVKPVWLIVLGMASLPVFVWNAAAGGGNSLTLIWLLGAIAGWLFQLWHAHRYSQIHVVCVVALLFGTSALLGRAMKTGFQPYDLQTAMLIAVIMFSILGLLIRSSWTPSLQRPISFLASYSYSLYLLHNTVLIVVLESLPLADLQSRAITAILLAHLVSYGLYLGFERHYRAVGSWLRPRFERMLVGTRSSPSPSQGLRAGLTDLASRP